MSLPPLYEHQGRAIDGACDAVREGFRSPLINSPTGSGKTRIGVEIQRRVAELARCSYAAGEVDLWVAHRHELLDQAAKQLLAAGATLGAGGIALHSVQSLAVMGQLPRARAVFLDEGHHYLADEWFAVAQYYSDALRFVLTATPCRHDGRAMGALCDTMITAATVRELIGLGQLVPCDVIAPAGKRDALAEHPVTAYQRHARGRLAIVFCNTRAHARELAEQFTSVGFPAEAVDGATLDEVRGDALERFRAGVTRVLTNVQVLTEGTDLPEAEVCINATGISHAGALIQRVGRVMRLSPWTCKERALLIDLKGAVHQFGLPDDDRTYSLHGTPIELAENLPSLAQCKRCGAVFRWKAACDRCGRKTAKPPMSPAIKREMLQRIAAVMPVADRATWYRAKVEEGRTKGYKPRWAQIQFKARFGYWPAGLGGA